MQGPANLAHCAFRAAVPTTFIMEVASKTINKHLSFAPLKITIGTPYSTTTIYYQQRLEQRDVLYADFTARDLPESQDRATAFRRTYNVLCIQRHTFVFYCTKHAEDTQG